MIKKQKDVAQNKTFSERTIASLADIFEASCVAVMVQNTHHIYSTFGKTSPQCFTLLQKVVFWSYVAGFKYEYILMSPLCVPKPHTAALMDLVHA